MRWFRRRTAAKVRDNGVEARARLARIKVGKSHAEDEPRPTYTYVVELGPEHGGRRVSVGQYLEPAEHVRLGMELVVWVHDEDVLIDAERSFAPLGVRGITHTDGWSCSKDGGGPEIEDAFIGIERDRKRGVPATARITGATWTSGRFGLGTQLKLDTVVELPGQAPYALELGNVTVPHYATHLVAVDAVLPAVVRDGRPDKVAIDWPAAAIAAPGVGEPPSPLLARADAGPTSAMSAGGGWGATPGDAAAGPAGGATIGAEPVDVPPIDGVTFEQYLAVEVDIARQRAKPAQWDAIAQGHGVAPGTWARTSQRWGMAIARNPQLAMRYADAIR